MIKFNELRISSNRYLIIDVSVKNEDYYKDVYIKMQVNKKSKYSKLYAFLTISIIILVLVVIILLALKKVKKR